MKRKKLQTCIDAQMIFKTSPFSGGLEEVWVRRSGVEQTPRVSELVVLKTRTRFLTEGGWVWGSRRTMVGGR